MRVAALHASACGTAWTACTSFAEPGVALPEPVHPDPIPPGDTGVHEEGGYYRLLGRTSVDVIKQGGYKASCGGALQLRSSVSGLCKHNCSRGRSRAWRGNGWRAAGVPILQSVPVRVHTPTLAVRFTHAALPAMQISALHIESALLEHPRIAEVAVLGLPDAESGEVRCITG